MIRQPMDYERIVSLVEQGAFVVFAAGSLDGEPMLAWLAAAPDPQAVMVATHPADAIRVAQAVGVIAELRQRARTWGFSPA